MKTKAFLTLLALLCVGSLQFARAQTVIMSDQFQQTSGQNSAQNWKVVVDGATVTTPSNGLTSSLPNSYLNSSIITYQAAPEVSIYNNYMALQLALGSLGSPTGGTRQYVSPAYAVTTTGHDRRAQIQFGIRLQNIVADDLSVTLEELDSTGATIGWLTGGLDFNSPSAPAFNFIRVVPATNWRTYLKFGEFRDATASVKVHIIVKNNSNHTGVVTVSIFSITSSTDTSYLMDAYSGYQGNVIPGTSGSVKVNLYDMSGTSGVTFNVTDQNDIALSPQPTVTYDSTGTVATVPLPQRGFYKIKVAPPSGVVTVNAAAVVDSSAPATTSPYGMFSCDTSNLMEYTAGSRWGRFFVETQYLLSYVGGTVQTSFTSRKEGHAESPAVDVPDMTLLLPDATIHQQWEACLGGLPQFMASVPSGATFQVGKNYPPLDWTQFKEMVEYVVSNLPPTVRDLEVINEPEFNWLGNSATKNSDINMYFKTVHDAVAELRSEGLLQNPNLKIIGPSFAHFYSPPSNYNDGQVTLQNALFAGGQFTGDTGLLTYVDEISMHGYNDSTAVQEPEAQFYDRIYQWENYERNTAHAPGLTTDGTTTGPLKPIHMTEYGFELGTGAGQVSELTRADYLPRAMIIAKAMNYTGIGGGIPFQSIMDFDLYDRSLLPWVMIDHDAYSPTPTYVSYTTAAKNLDDSDQAGPYLNNVPTLPSDAGCNYQCATFQNSSTLFSETCLWNSSTTGATLAMHIPYTASFTGVDSMGRTLTVPGGGVLTLSTSPVFLRGYKFFAGTVTSTITVPHATTIPTTSLPPFSDILCPTTFTLQGATPTFTLKAPTAPGTYSIMAKNGSTSVWAWYKVVVN